MLWTHGGRAGGKSVTYMIELVKEAPTVEAGLNCINQY